MIKIFIAECGINHNGNIDTAIKMIDMVCLACDKAEVPRHEVVIKFQKRKVRTCVPKSQWDNSVNTPWGEMFYLDYKEKIEFGKEEYDIIDKYCRHKEIKWTASVWDIPSLNFILKYDVPFIKIPSAKITDLKLLKAVNKSKTIVIISTGMSTRQEISVAMELLSNCDVTIMHCNSSYPAKDNELNLNYIKTLKEQYPNHYIGYSGHEEGISASIIAKSLNASVIERHVTLSRSMWGSDQAASITFDQLWRLLRDLKKVNMWLGNGIKEVYDSELLIKKKLRGTKWTKK